MDDVKVKTSFSYTDQFGQEYNLTKTFTEVSLINRGIFEFLVDEFKLFLRACEYPEETVKMLQIVED